MTLPALKKAPKERSALLSFGLRNPLLFYGALLVLLAASVAIVTRGIFSGTPPLTLADVGTPAAFDYKAALDFTYSEVDLDATEKKREQAALAVLPVLDFDLEERDRVVEQTRDAFRFMQELYAEYHAQLLQTMAARRPGKGEEERGGGDARTLSPEAQAKKRELDAWLASQVEERREEFFRRLHQTLAAEEYAALASQEFSREIEDHLVYLISGILQYKVLPTTLRQSVRQPEAGVRLRITRGATAVDEIDVRDDFTEFVSIHDAVERLVLMARKGLKSLDPSLRDRLVDVAGRLLVPNCQFNKRETDLRREQAKLGVESLSVTRTFRQGQIIVDRGHPITPQHVAIYQASLQESPDADIYLAALGNGLTILGLVWVLVSFFSRFVRKFAVGRKDLLFMGLWIVLMVLSFRVLLEVLETFAESWILIPPEAYIYLVPLAAVPMLVRMVLNSETAVVVTVIEAALVAMMVGWEVPYLLFAIVTGLMAAGGVGRAKQRTDMLVAALKTGGVGAIFVLGLAAASGTLVTAEGWWSILLAFLGGVVSGLVVTAMLPAVEALFGYTTNIKLLELANLNSPLLKDLAIRAPGTFHHSILVGNLVEIAAESIHANPLLARVGAYYHDVGKLRSANYFAENQKQGKNPHDKLAPSMSALILKEHVRDGARLLRSLGYPKILADICEQHTGTTLISFFYHKARSQAAERGEPEPLESDYRYPGPRPQTREAALVFLGDSVEAAAKSMADPTPARLQGMVNSLISARFIDGQLGECNLSLGDLNQIAQAFTRGLMGIYHSRPEYPGASRGKKPTAPPRRTTQTPVPGKRERSSAESLPASKAARQERTPLPFDRAALAAAPTEVPGSITELPAMLARQLSQLQFPGGDDHPPRPDPSSPRRGAKRSADEQPSEAAGEVAGDRAAGRGALPAGAGGERAPAAPVPGDLVPPGAGDPDRRGES